MMRRVLERDGNWIFPVAGLVGGQLILAVAMALISGFYRRSPLPESLLVASTWITLAMIYLWVRSRRSPLASIEQNLPTIRALIVGGALLATQFSLVRWFKMLLPFWSHGFWADPLLADVDKAIFGFDPWIATKGIGTFGLVSFFYWLWIPLMGSVIYWTFLSDPSERRSRVIVSFFLVCAFCATTQFLLPSSGPLFYDLAGWGDRFIEVFNRPDNAVSARIWLWKFHVERAVKAGIGISAFPSMHVAVAAWFGVIAPRRFKAAAWAFFLMIFFGSVYLGMHYFVDGLFGAIIAVVSWRLANLRTRRVSSMEAAR